MVEMMCRPVCQMGIFMICGQAVLLLRPNQEYEKYIKLLLSLLLLVQMVNFVQYVSGFRFWNSKEQEVLGERDYYKRMEQAFNERLLEGLQNEIVNSVLEQKENLGQEEVKSDAKEIGIQPIHILEMQMDIDN